MAAGRGVNKVLYHRCRCGALIPQGVGMCAGCQQGEQARQQSRHMQYNLYRRNKKTAAFYVSPDWRKTRDVALKMFDYIDIYAYFILHRIETADIVHHIVPIEDDWNKRLDVDNLIPLSSRSHGIIEALYKKDDSTKEMLQKQLKALREEYLGSRGGVQKSME